MSAPSFILLVSLSLAAGGCIEANRAQGEADTAAPPADATGETTAPDVGHDVAPDATPPSCGPDAPCPQPDNACVEASCVDGGCVETARTGDVCDDGDPCTRPGSCDASGVCVPGGDMPASTECAAATVCAGPGRCKAGVCAPGDPVTCPEPALPCRVSACDEGAGGCVEGAAADGAPCLDGKVCDRGGCVPPQMRYVAAGEFTMGCGGDDRCAANAEPAHPVWLSAYAIDLHEITNADYLACATDVLSIGRQCPLRGVEVGDVVADDDALAAARLSWTAAEAVCAYYGKRLCTEAEWEKAARGADARRYPWGSTPDPSCTLAVMSETGAGRGCGLERQAPPGTRPLGASAYGLLDMSGNVAEWVADHYDRDAYTRRDPNDATIDPFVSNESAASPLTRVLRGGSWRDGEPALRATTRRPEVFSTFTDDTGARCCFTPSVTSSSQSTAGDGSR